MSENLDEVDRGPNLKINGSGGGGEGIYVVSVVGGKFLQSASQPTSQGAVTEWSVQTWSEGKGREGKEEGKERKTDRDKDRDRDRDRDGGDCGWDWLG